MSATKRAVVSASTATPASAASGVYARVAGSSSRTSEVDDAVEQLLIKLNRSKFTSSDERSMTIVAARSALRVFKILLERSRPRPISRVIARVSRICQQSFSRAPAFRFVLANVTRMVLMAIRDAGAAVSRAAEKRALEAAGDLSALADGEGMLGDDDDADDYEVSSPTRANMARSVSFSAFAPHQQQQQAPQQGHFPRMDTEDMDADGSSKAAGGSGSGMGRTADTGDENPMGEGECSNVSFGERAATPLTEATIPRIPSHFEGERYGGSLSLDYREFRDKALSAIADIGENLTSMMDLLCSHATDHVADGETILTFGSSHTTLKFLAAAALAGRRFRVIALAAEPHGGASSLVKVLAPYDIPVDVVPDSDCFNVVPRASKVLLSTEGVLANGGLLAPTGSLMLCIVAKVFSVEVVIVATTVKITPYYPSDTACSSLVKLSTSEAKEMLWTTFSDPSRVLPHEHVHSVVPCNGMSSPLVFNPTVEYVTPEHVSLFVTDSGEFTPAFIHRYLKEQYHAEDTHLQVGRLQRLGVADTTGGRASTALLRGVDPLGGHDRRRVLDP